MKTADNYFRGFPTLWNAVAFYMFVLAPPPWLAAAIVAALAVLTFVPIRFVHPMRVMRWRKLNIAALVVWSLLGAIALYRDLAPGPWVAGALLALGCYFLLVGSFNRADVHARASA